MSHKSNSSGRVLQPEIPPPSTYPENPPIPPPPPLTLTSVEPLESDGPSTKGFWLFRRNTQHRAGPKKVPSKRAGVIAPSVERSLSEPSSPTEPTGTGSTGRDKSEGKINYITMAEKLLEESKVRFYGNMEAWDEFNERFKNLFANGRPAGGKLIKPHTPVHGAQAVARSIVEDIQAALEAMDQEMLVDDSLISTILKEDVRPPRTLTPEPWFDPSTVNPAIFDKVKKHRSINPIGTWHGHSRSRSTTVTHAIPEFAALNFKNGKAGKTDQGSTAGTNNHESAQAQERDVGEKEERKNQGEKDRDRGKGKAKEVERDTDPTRAHENYGDRERDGMTSKEPERGRRDRSRNRRGDIPLIEYPSRPEPPSRERQVSDPAIYTRSLYRRQASPDSLAPAVYTLAEDVEVRDGSSSTETTGGKNLAGIGIPRAPTIVNYPDEDGAYTGLTPSLFRAGPSTRTNPRIGGPATSPLSPVAEIPASGVPVGDNNTRHRRRRRSRSLDHELNGRANRERPRSRSPQDRPRTRDRDRDRERETLRDKGRERDDHDRDRDRDRDKDKDRDKGKDKERDRDRQRDKERDREKGRDRDKDRERDRDKEQEREKEKDKDKEHEREKDKDKYGSIKIKHLEGERDRERQDSGGRRDKDRDRDRDRPRERDRDKDKDRDRENRPRDKDKKKDRERDRDRDRDRSHKDRERNYDHNHLGRERPTNPPSSALTGATLIPSDAAAATSTMPGAYRDGPTPPGSAVPPGVTAPPPHLVPHTVSRSGAPTNGPLLSNPTSESRFMEILTSPIPPMPFNLPGQP